MTWGGSESSCATVQLLKNYYVFVFLCSVSHWFFLKQFTRYYQLGLAILMRREFCIVRGAAHLCLLGVCGQSIVVMTFQRLDSFSDFSVSSHFHFIRWAPPLAYFLGTSLAAFWCLLNEFTDEITRKNRARVENLLRLCSIMLEYSSPV
jgi:hypothetical protein